MLKDLLFLFVGGLITVIVQLYPLFIMGDILPTPSFHNHGQITLEILYWLISYLEYIVPSTFVAGAMHMTALKWFSVKRPAHFLLFASLAGAIFGCLNVLMMDMYFRATVAGHGREVSSILTYKFFFTFSICGIVCGLANGIFHLFRTARYSHPDDGAFKEDVRRLFHLMWQGGLCIAIIPTLLLYAYSILISGFSFSTTWGGIPFSEWLYLILASLSHAFIYGVFFIVIMYGIDRSRRSWKLILPLGPIIVLAIESVSSLLRYGFLQIQFPMEFIYKMLVTILPTTILFGAINSAIYLFLRRRTSRTNSPPF